MIRHEPLLLVDDDEALLHGLRRSLQSEGWDRVEILSDANHVEAWLASHPASLVTLDLHMPGIDGRALLERIRISHPHLPVLVLTAADDLATAVECMKRGARDYLVKPVSLGKLIQSLLTQLEREAALAEARSLREHFLDDSLQHPEAFAPLLTQAPQMQRIFAYAEAVTRSGMPVLVTGETGTGKELIARSLHDLRHPERPFVAVNVAGLDDQLFSDTLFGHAKGAFSGAIAARAGLVEKADGGTLFLDEIGDLSPESQIKLLRLLQEGEYYPLGCDVPRKAHVWVVTASHRSLDELPHFRKDLYYRLQSHCIRLPPLRERIGDLPLLVRHFCREASLAVGIALAADFPKRLAAALEGYPFPGNVRELQGMVFDVVGASHGTFSHGLLSRWIPAAPSADVSGSEDAPVRFGTRLPTLREATRLLLQESLVRTGQNRTAAAAILGVSRQTLLNHLKAESEARTPLLVHP